MTEEKIVKFDPDNKIDFSLFQAEWDKIGDSKDNLILMHNFLEKEDIDYLYSYVERYKDDENFRGGNDKRDFHVKKEDSHAFDLLKKYEKKIYNEVVEHFVKKLGVKVKEEPQNSLHFVKWPEGMKSGLHADCERPDGTPAFHAGYYRLNISALIYLNDNYEGGEIIFPSYNFYLKPSPGDLVIFPSRYRHFITEVKGTNNRYTMPIWFTFDLPDIYIQDDVFDSEDSVILWKKDGEKYVRDEAF